jgi:protein-disulfide isomerase
VQSLPVIIERYVRAGRVRVVFANLPILGQPSVQAARMAVAVGLQGHMFEFIAAFFREGPATVSDDLLSRVAGEVAGVDVAMAMAHRDSSEVTTDLQEARTTAQHFSVLGTPTFLLGKTGAVPQNLPQARATKPETLTGPIDALLAQP